MLFEINILVVIYAAGYRYTEYMYVSMYGKQRHKDQLTAVTPNFANVVTC